MKTKKLENFPINKEPAFYDSDNFINPFQHDYYHMGSQIGKNVFVMFTKFQDDIHDYIIIVNTKTGERLKIIL